MTSTTADRLDPLILVLFGATGDLARRMIYPALHGLAAGGLLPEDYRLICTGRHEPDDGVDALIHDALDEFADGTDDEAAADLVGRASFVVSEDDDGSALADAIAQSRDALGDETRVLVYLSVPPQAMQGIVRMLGETGIADEARLVVEKPFGSDLESSRELDAAIGEVVDEEHVFRVDHFLADEAVQNLLPLRLANPVIAAAWNGGDIASVQIDVPEKIDVEGRGSFYEGIGALRDMVVTHLSQVLGMVALEAPERLDAKSLRDEKARVFHAIRPIDPGRVVFGQYEGYRDEDDVDPDSAVETFVAAEVFVDTDRWRDVPFHLRTGKALPETRSTVTIVFRPPSGGPFGDAGSGELVLELGETPGIALELRTKRPGPGHDLTRTVLEAGEAEADGSSLSPYERLLHDAMRGDQTLFARGDEVDRLWQVFEPVLQHPPRTLPYAKGSWGPEAARHLPGEHGWHVGGADE